jgi:phage gp29-like protein
MKAYPIKIKNRVRKLYVNGIRPKLISEKVGISINTISTWIKDLPKTNQVGCPIGHKPWNKGKVFIQMIGNKHAVHKGKVQINSTMYRARQVLKEINPCEKCGKLKEKFQMVIHHIDENDYNNKINNLMRLCRTCHINLHRKKLELGRKKKSL